MPPLTWNHIPARLRQPRPWLLSLVVVGQLWGAGTMAIALELNDSGPEVETLQRQLQAAGVYDGEITGFFGELTQAAVRAFQQAQGLTVDGVVGTATQTALTAELATAAAGTSTEVTTGDRGPIVAEIQTLLRTAGHLNRPVTGSFDEATETALRAFQADRGLSVDGIAGPQTLAALRTVTPPAAPAAIANPDTLRLGSEGDRVVALQERLQVLGFYSSGADGVFGAQTEAAVRAFQSAYNLEVDGVAGPATRAAIGDAILAVAQQNNQPAPTPVAAAPVAPAIAPAPVTPAIAPPPTATTIPVTPPAGVMVTVPTVPTVPPLPMTGGTDLPSATPPNYGATATSTTPIEYSVLQLQRQLRSMDLYQGTLDGQLGIQTNQAIEAAQERYGVSPADFAAP